ncbi:hypothetical protein BJX65DRAFT_307885 [Aspergillus insuetus]
MVVILMRKLMCYQKLFSTWSERQEKGKKSQVRDTATLESLPEGLRIEVLKPLPDCRTLCRLLYASPTYYRTYTPLQQDVLTAIITRQYVQGTAADVIAIHLSSAFYHADIIRTKAEAIAFLDLYRHARGKILVQEYHNDLDQCDLAGELHRDETGKIPISSLTRMRIVRAICRIQIFNYVFYQPRQDSIGGEPNRTEYFQLEEAYNLFCATFPPWERDEMWAVYRWFEDRTQRALDKLADPAVDTLSFALDPYYQDYIFVSMCSRGPMLLARLLLESDLKNQYDVIQNQIHFWVWTYSTPGLEDCLLFSPASELLYPADQLVGLCRQDMGEQTSLFHLQMPTLGWQERSYNTRDDFAELGLRVFGLGIM